ncbi:MAG TPA: GatB/YqeY domain-containing protein [Bryobacteraceae bacterium]|nr:GatB/YqeY domain-containing protein [Bryobacteraceae bacterium]
MALIERIQQDLTRAMKERDEARMSALRMILSALKRHQVDSMKPLDEAAELQVLNSLVKQRREAAELFRKGNRPELAEKEEAELRLIESYLPAAPTEDELEAAVAAAIAETGATSMKQMGAVMKAAQARLAGKRVDGRLLSEKVKARLQSG